ncbi:hypothetical protein GCM10009777_36380 [Microbacterium pumilum]|uniref:Cupin type-2 domain-containing protein n=1 Tax=Microbacterium pumilum TaxID=344165 RepID=A0ABP5EJ34_9MICO
MSESQTIVRPEQPDYLAPDGSEVRLLCRIDGGSAAEFLLPAGKTSRPVAHRTVEELWYVAEGRGEMWRSSDRSPEPTRLIAGTCVSIPVGTAFQFRSDPDADLRIFGVTIPPWPLDEAMPAEGPWEPSVG